MDYQFQAKVKTEIKSGPGKGDLNLWLQKDEVITCNNYVRDGWLNIVPGKNRWVWLQDMKPYNVVEPPPVDPPTETAYPAEIMARWLKSDGTYTEYFTYRITP